MVSTSGPRGAEVSVLRLGPGTPHVLLSDLLAGVGAAYGMSLSHDGRWLAVATPGATLVLSVAQLVAGKNADPVVGRLVDSGTGQIEAAFSSDDRYVFVTDERSAALSVFDVGAALAGDFQHPAVPLGQVPLGPAPVGIAVAPDGTSVYVTTEGSTDGSLGALWRIDEHTAVTHPEDAVVGHAAAGRDTVRVALSPSGDMAWVTARGSNELYGFNTADLRHRPSLALRAAVRVGMEPTGIAITADGRFAVVTNSARFVAPDQSQNLVVVDLAAARKGRAAIASWIAAGDFPREVALQGTTGIVTNFNSDTVELFGLPR